MRHRMFVMLVLLTITALFVAGCGAVTPAAPAETAESATEAPAEEASAEEAPAEEEAAEAPAEAYKVAVILPSTINDLSWSQSLIDSLKAVQDELGEDSFSFAYSENMFNVTDAAPAMRDYAEQGFNLVIAHGTQYGTTLFELAPDYPDTSFAWGTAADAGVDAGLTNVFAFDPRAEQGGYVNGVIAAMLSESKNIGIVGPIDAGDAKLYIDGFVAGVKSVAPDATIGLVFTGSFGDTALAAEAANTLINAGADVLTGTAQQVSGAIGVASEKGIPWLGTQGDQTPLAPELVMSTNLYDWTGVIKEIMALNAEGIMGEQVFQLTLENGATTMVYSDSLAPEIVEAAEAAKAAVIAGEVEIPAEREID